MNSASTYALSRCISDRHQLSKLCLDMQAAELQALHKTRSDEEPVSMLSHCTCLQHNMHSRVPNSYSLIGSKQAYLARPALDLCPICIGLTHLSVNSASLAAGGLINLAGMPSGISRNPSVQLSGKLYGRTGNGGSRWLPISDTDLQLADAQNAIGK